MRASGYGLTAPTSDASKLSNISVSRFDIDITNRIGPSRFFSVYRRAQVLFLSIDFIFPDSNDGI